jgi:diamine N-acetyltransferase
MNKNGDCSNSRAGVPPAPTPSCPLPHQPRRTPSGPIRPWTQADLPAIQRLLLETWLEAYGGFIPRADVAGYLYTQYSQPKLEALFADPDVTGLVAEAEGAVAGYAKLYHARAEKRFYLHQLYVLPAWQGLGLGHRLMACAEERARELGADRIWLGVMVKNERAVAWYRKLGYTVTETAPFAMGSTTVDHYIGYLPLPLARRMVEAPPSREQPRSR